MTAPAYLSNPPRRVRWTRGIITRVIVYVLILVPGGIVIASEYHAGEVTRQFFRTGRLTTARVIARRAVGSKSVYYVDVVYKAAAASESTTIETDINTFDTCRRGTSKMITYLPKQPRLARFGRVTAAATTSADRQVVTSTVVVLLLLSLLEVLLWREYRLVRTGIVVAATVKSVREDPVRGGWQHTILYSFELGDKSVNGSSVRNGPIEPTSTDSKFLVIYDPSRPQRNTPIDDITQVEPLSA
ncbi:MAG: hypothetical protein ACLQVD_16125 [Capsulimonadaceae bacterium]